MPAALDCVGSIGLNLATLPLLNINSEITARYESTISTVSDVTTLETPIGANLPLGCWVQQSIASSLASDISEPSENEPTD